MAFWNPSRIAYINTGTAPNDGTGDPIRDAFNKVDNNFSNISVQLAGVDSAFINLTVDGFRANNATIRNLVFTNIVAENAAFTGNLEAAYITANTAMYGNALTITGNTLLTGNNIIDGNTLFTGNINLAANVVVSSNFIPAGNIVQDLGAPNNFFRNLYVQNTISSTEVSISSDAGMLQIHANMSPGGDNKDVGILGKYWDYSTSSNSFAFFGHQNTTSNFVYVQTLTDPTQGNSIVSGTYGNTQFGSQYLSNTTPATSTATGALIVAGGAGIGGNLYAGLVSTNRVITTVANVSSLSLTGTVSGNLTVDGNVYTGLGQVITTGSVGVGAVYNGTGSIFVGNTLFVAETLSTSPTTGTVVLSRGGLGVAGNINTGGNIAANAIVGPYYGTIQTANQPNITGVGALGNLIVTGILNTNSLQSTTVGVQNITAFGSVNFTGATVSGLSVLNVGGGITGGTVSGTSGVYDGVNRVITTSAGTGNLTIDNVTGTIELTATGPGSTTVGNGNNIPVITTDAYGRIVGLTTVPVSTVITGLIVDTISANTITSGRITANIINAATIGNVNANIVGRGSLSALTVTSNINGNISGYAYSETLSTVTGRDATTGAAVTINNTLTMGGAIVPAANVTYNLGSTTAWWNNVYGQAVQARYADLAEIYASDAEYSPGTVVAFGGDAEITITDTFADPRVAGAISTDPAYLMNAKATGLPVALRGRIPVKVVGPVVKGDSLVTSNVAGHAQSIGTRLGYAQAVFAKAIETNLTDGPKVITAVIL